MLVTMQYELRAVLSQHGDEGVAVDQPAVAPFGLGLRRVVDQHDAERAGVLVEERGKPLELRGAEPSSGTECQCWNRRTDSNQDERTRVCATNGNCGTVSAGVASHAYSRPNVAPGGAASTTHRCRGCQARR